MTHLVTSVARCQDRETLEKRLACLADAGPEAIAARLDEIAEEWSAGRMTKSAIGVRYENHFLCWVQIHAPPSPNSAPRLAAWKFRR